MKHKIAVVGGSCIDIFAAPSLPLVMHDSNPGTVHIGFGGVGRNIAENLARLEQDAVLVALFGNDELSCRMRDHTAKAGVDVTQSITHTNAKPPYYISINDSDGDMAAAISDISICDSVTPSFLARRMDILDACDGVIVDTNIPQDAIQYLAETTYPPLFADAVSTRKAVKLKRILHLLYAIKANLLETQALLDIPVTNDLSSLTAAANRFHDKGISYVFITLGMAGAFLSCPQGRKLRKAYPVHTVNANGCGDAFAAAAFVSALNDHSPDMILQKALAAAAIAAQSAHAVSQEISMSAIHNFINETRNPS